MKFILSIRYMLVTTLSILLLTACGGDGGGTTPASTSVTKAATLTIAAEVPAAIAPQPANAINGTATFTVDTASNAITGTLTITGDSGRVIAAHIHDGDTGVSGPVVVPLVNNGNGIWGVTSGTVLTAAQMARFTAGGYYVNAHTTLNATGEIRGQLN